MRVLMSGICFAASIAACHSAPMVDSATITGGSIDLDGATTVPEPAGGAAYSPVDPSEPNAAPDMEGIPNQTWGPRTGNGSAASPTDPSNDGLRPATRFPMPPDIDQSGAPRPPSTAAATSSSSPTDPPPPEANQSPTL